MKNSTTKKKKQQHDPSDEPVILPLRDHVRPEPPPDNDDQPDQPRDDDRTETTAETYWAGRNHAMRRSARWAA